MMDRRNNLHVKDAVREKLQCLECSNFPVGRHRLAAGLAPTWAGSRGWNSRHVTPKTLELPRARKKISAGIKGVSLSLVDLSVSQGGTRSYRRYFRTWN